jgi:hypothetical protein
MGNASQTRANGGTVVVLWDEDGIAVQEVRIKSFTDIETYLLTRVLSTIIQTTALIPAPKPRAPRPIDIAFAHSTFHLVRLFPSALDALFLLATETQDLFLDLAFLARAFVARLEAPMFRVSAVLHTVANFVACRS